MEILVFLVTFLKSDRSVGQNWYGNSDPGTNNVKFHVACYMYLILCAMYKVVAALTRV
jgi:hypothetical protein